MFGLGGYVIAKFISPYLNVKLKMKSAKIIWIINSILLVIVFTDLIYSMYNLNIGYGITTMQKEISTYIIEHTKNSYFC